VAAEVRLEARAAVAESVVGEAGSTAFVAHVNKELPLGKTAGDRAFNCANCAIATDASLSGRPASALPGEVTKAEDLAAHYGTSWAPGSPGASSIEASMTAAGPGARGIALGKYPNKDVGHFFNVVNEDGAIRFVDGQSGAPANLAPFERLWLLRTP
jgi:filamentous hemagglutinin